MAEKTSPSPPALMHLHQLGRRGLVPVVPLVAKSLLERGPSFLFPWALMAWLAWSC